MMVEMYFMVFTWLLPFQFHVWLPPTSYLKIKWGTYNRWIDSAQRWAQYFIYLCKMPRNIKLNISKEMNRKRRRSNGIPEITFWPLFYYHEIQSFENDKRVKFFWFGKFYINPNVANPYVSLNQTKLLRDEQNLSPSTVVNIST